MGELALAVHPQHGAEHSPSSPPPGGETSGETDGTLHNRSYRPVSCTGDGRPPAMATHPHREAKGRGGGAPRDITRPRCHHISLIHRRRRQNARQSCRHVDRESDMFNVHLQLYTGSVRIMITVQTRSFMWQWPPSYSKSG